MTKGLPSVAILMSVYNDGAYLWSSLSAICAQENPATEIILIDDGSTDCTLSVMKSFQRENPRIKIIKNHKNIGLLPSINIALEEASSDYIVWCAADDIILPNFLKRSLEVLKDFPDAGICFSQFAVFIDKPNEVKRKRLYSRDHMGASFDLGDKPHFLSPDRLYERLNKSYLWLSGNTALVRREGFKEVFGSIEKTAWHADWLAFYTVAMREGVCIVPEYLTIMREVEKSFSRSGMSQKTKQLDILIEMLNFINSKPMRDISHFFKNRPCLFTPFGTTIVLNAMIKHGSYLLALKYFSLLTKAKSLHYLHRALYKLSKYI